MPLTPEIMRNVLRKEAAGELDADELRALQSIRNNDATRHLLPPAINSEASAPVWARIKAGFASNPLETSRAITDPQAEKVVNQQAGTALYRMPDQNQFTEIRAGPLTSVPSLIPETTLSTIGATYGASAGMAGGPYGAVALGAAGAGGGASIGEGARKLIGRELLGLRGQESYGKQDVSDLAQAGVVNAALPVVGRGVGIMMKGVTPSMSGAAREAEASIGRLRASGANLPAEMLTAPHMTENKLVDIVGNIMGNIPGGGQTAVMTQRSMEAMRGAVKKLFPQELASANMAASDALVALRDTKRAAAELIRSREYGAIEKEAEKKFKQMQVTIKQPSVLVGPQGQPLSVPIQSSVQRQVGGAAFNTANLKTWAEKNAKQLKEAGNVEKEYGGGSVYDAVARAADDPQYAVIQKQLSGINEYARNLKARGETGPALKAVTDAQNQLHEIIKTGLTRVSPALYQRWDNANKLVAHAHEMLDNQTAARVFQLAEKKAANSPNDAAALLMSQSPDMARNIHQLRQATTTAGGHTIAAVAEAKAASAALDSVAAVKLIVEATNPKTGMVNGVKLRELVSGAEKIQPHAMTEYLSKESKQSLSDLARVYEHLEAGQAGGMGKFAGAIYGVSSVGAIAAALYTGRIEAAAAGLIPFASANAIGRLFTNSKLIQAIRDGGKYSPDKWLKTKMGAQAMTAITDSLTQYNRDMERAGLSEGPKQQLRRDQLSPGMSMTPSGLPQKPMLLPVPSRKPTYEEAVGTASEVERMMRRGAFGR